MTKRTTNGHEGTRIAWIFVLCVVVFPASFVKADEPEQIFRAGAAAVDITPKNGVLLDGTIMKIGPVRGVHDRLFSRAIVMCDGKTTVAIVISDACMIGPSVFDTAKEIARRETGIPATNILLAATHSHAAVRAMHIGKGPLDDEYHDFLAKQMAAAVVRAHRNLAPAKIGFGSFDRPDLVACRRFVCRPGTVGPNPFGDTTEQIKSVAGSSSGVIRSAGPIDPQVSLLSMQHADGTPLAVLANFSVHYCGGYQSGQVSADYFGAFATHLEQQLGASAGHPSPVAIMSNGTSGDQGSISRGGKRYAPYQRLEEAGRELADEALDVVRQIEHTVPEHVAAAHGELELDVRRPSTDRLAWAEAALANPNAKLPHRWSRIYAREAMELKEYPPQTKVPLQAIRIGGIGIAAIPCEVFAETGLAVKQESPLRNTFTIELANGYSGYLPTPEQHRLGGYETWPARSSHLEIDAESKIRAEVLRLLEVVAEN